MAQPSWWSLNARSGGLMSSFGHAPLEEVECYKADGILRYTPGKLS